MPSLIPNLNCPTTSLKSSHYLRWKVLWTLEQSINFLVLQKKRKYNFVLWIAAQEKVCFGCLNLWMQNRFRKHPFSAKQVVCFAKSSTAGGWFLTSSCYIYRKKMYPFLYLLQRFWEYKLHQRHCVFTVSSLRHNKTLLISSWIYCILNKRNSLEWYYTWGK